MDSAQPVTSSKTSVSDKDTVTTVPEDFILDGMLDNSDEEIAEVSDSDEAPPIPEDYIHGTAASRYAPHAMEVEAEKPVQAPPKVAPLTTLPQDSTPQHSDVGDLTATTSITTLKEPYLANNTHRYVTRRGNV